MKREQWLIWIAAAIVLTFVLAAIGYLAGTKTAIFSGPSDADAASRYQRGVNTFNAGKALAQARGWPFNWRPVELAGVGHDAKKMFAAPQASAALSP
jgi:hypothetical protein